MKVGDLVRYKNVHGMKNTLGIVLAVKKKIVQIQWANHPKGPGASFVEEHEQFLEEV